MPDGIIAAAMPPVGIPGIDMVRVPMSTAYWDTGGLITCWPTAFAESTAAAAMTALREKGFMQFL
jgi:hypothetical protein